MNRKTVFLLLPVLVAGAFIGHAGKNMFREPPAGGEKSIVKSVPQRPRFGDVRPAMEGRIRGSRPSRANAMELDGSLKQYLRMGTEELWAELEKWNKKRVGGWGNTKQTILLPYICTRLGKEAPQQTLAYLKDRKEMREYMQPVLEAWAEKNPEAAMAYCRERIEDDQDSGNKSQWVGRYIELLSDESPEKAFDYLSTLPAEERDSSYMYTPLYRLAEKEPEKLPEILEKLRPTMKRDEGLDSIIVSLLAGSNWNAVEQWINTVPKEGQVEVLSDAVASLPQDQALEKLKTLDEKTKIKVLGRLSHRIVYDESPVKALEFIQNNATEEQAVKIMEKGGQPLDMYDTEVRSYLDKMPAGSVKDSILRCTIEYPSYYPGSESYFLDRKMEDAFSLIDQMSSSEKKEEATDRVLNNWQHEDPQAAKSWMEQSSLAEDKKKEFIRQCDDALKPAQDGE